MMADADPRHQHWIEQWKRAAPALAEQRRRDLSRMTDAEALAASENLLSLAGSIALSSARRLSSGLVEQQGLLYRRRSA